VGVVNLSCRPYTAPFLLKTLGDWGIPYHYYNAWPADFNDHNVWFILLGTFAFNHVLSAEEANDIVAALQAGKNIYLEGGDTWCYDPEKNTIGPWFGVNEFLRGWDVKNVQGAKGTLLDGLNLAYAHEVEDICIDRVHAVSPAEAIMKANYGPGESVAVSYDAGGYRTIASSIPLGGLVDGDWEDCRKEILLRYLDFLGISGIQLLATEEAHLAKTVTVRFEGNPGDGYLLFASLADFYLDVPGYGAFRLDPNYMFTLGSGVVPPSGRVEFEIPIPRSHAYLGMEIHLQVVTGSMEMSPDDAHLTNREILTIVE
jgi:hypothetical protein